jgi:16S rRNA (cytosine1402-N4)-methyltransferase
MSQHQSVLLNQAVDALVRDRDGLYIDGTFGRGGHSVAILSKLSASGRLLVIDKDPKAVNAANQLAANDSRVKVHHGSFADLKLAVKANFSSSEKVCGLLLDLGVSSPQIDEAERGFSFQQDGPLDMRMDTTTGETAAEWLALASEEEIANVLYHKGEERFSRRMAKAIVCARSEGPIASTLQLAEIVKAANPSWERSKHPATRAFQAIRIHINRELDDLQQVLDQALEVLCAGGRMVLISFHSLEDRLVKQFMQRQARGDEFPRDLPLTQNQLKPRLRLVGKAVKANKTEVSENNRARSAVMRCAEVL